MEARMKKVARALAEFNRWHGREAVAELVELRGSSIVVRLSGPFCRTCGPSDYFDDLKIELERVLGKPLEITGVYGEGAECYVVVYEERPNHTFE